MKKPLIILLYLPMTGFGYTNKQSPLDALLNIVLEGALNYFEHRSDIIHNGEFKTN
jgi:hypothetical protein